MNLRTGQCWFEADVLDDSPSSAGPAPRYRFHDHEFRPRPGDPLPRWTLVSLPPARLVVFDPLRAVPDVLTLVDGIHDQRTQGAWAPTRTCVSLPRSRSIDSPVIQALCNALDPQAPDVPIEDVPHHRGSVIIDDELVSVRDRLASVIGTTRAHGLRAVAVRESSSGEPSLHAATEAAVHIGLELEKELFIDDAHHARTNVEDVPPCQ
jgi:hypothetical protein